MIEADTYSTVLDCSVSANLLFCMLVNVICGDSGFHSPN